MKRLGFFLLLVVLAALSASLAGCGSIGVEVWERDVLAKSEMQLDSEMIDRALDDHIYFSKEASSGGRGFGGGGCGCN
jgi:predicted small lipoprotein YifL